MVAELRMGRLRRHGGSQETPERLVTRPREEMMLVVN